MNTYYTRPKFLAIMETTHAIEHIQCCRFIRIVVICLVAIFISIVLHLEIISYMNPVSILVNKSLFSSINRFSFIGHAVNTRKSSFQLHSLDFISLSEINQLYMYLTFLHECIIII